MTGNSTKALRRLLAEAFEPTLSGHGFIRDGRRQVWVRQQEVAHVVALHERYGTLSVQWGLYSPELSRLLWSADAPKPIDVAFAFMSGHLSGVIRAHADGFKLNDAGGIDRRNEEVPFDEFVPALRRDLSELSKWLEPLSTRAEVVAYLLSDQEETDRRGFIVPAKLPLKLLVCAGLAILDRAINAPELTDRAIVAQAPWNRDGKSARVATLRSMATP